MAAPVITKNLTTISDCEVVNPGGQPIWETVGAGVSGLVVNSENFVEGSNSIACVVSGSGNVGGVRFDAGSAASIDISAAVDHVYVWVCCTTPDIIDTKAGGGIRLRLSSSLTDYKEWSINGSDNYEGGWVRYCVSPDAAGTIATSGTLDQTDIRYFSIYLDMTATLADTSAVNLFVDIMDYGSGLTITKGDETTPCSWQKLYDDDVANGYGIIRKVLGKYLIQGRIIIGDDSGSDSTYWLDTSNADVVFETAHVGSGVTAMNVGDLLKLDFVGNTTTVAIASLVQGVRYKIKTVGTGHNWTSIGAASATVGVIFEKNATAGTGTGSDATTVTDVTFGVVTGSGDSRQGIRGGSITGQTPDATGAWKIDAFTDIANLDVIHFYGTTMDTLVNPAFDDVSKTEIISCTFLSPFGLKPNAALFLDCFFYQSGAWLTQIKTTHNMKKCSFGYADGTEYMIDLLEQGTYDFDEFNFIDTDGASGYDVRYANYVAIQDESIVSGRKYEIAVSGTTDWTTFGAPDSNVGTQFVATSGGSDIGNGTAKGISIIRNLNGSNAQYGFQSTYGLIEFLNIVNLTVTIVDTDNAVIQNIRVGIYKLSDNTELMNELTTASGIATEEFDYDADTPVVIKARKGSTGGTRYVAASTTGTITNAGLIVTMVLRVDPYNNATT